MPNKKEEKVRRILCIIVDNEPGMLSRVIDLFAARGYNIESLTVSETEHQANISRITIVTTGKLKVILRITALLEKLVPVHRVTINNNDQEFLEREMALVKVISNNNKRLEALRIASAFRARLVDTTIESFVFEINGKPWKVDRFISIMSSLGLAEVARTGVAAIARGKKTL